LGLQQLARWEFLLMQLAMQLELAYKKNIQASSGRTSFITFSCSEGPNQK